MKKLLLAVMLTFAMCATSLAGVVAVKDAPKGCPHGHCPPPRPHVHRHHRPHSVYPYMYPPVFVHPTPYTRPYYGFYNYYPNGSYFYYGGSGIYLYVR
jgi:hypothetical protein